ncbi:dihydrolipoamide acetyltransferase family protein [Psychromicrobium xiongbiense]|uniref:dihydrolipoamide acetyltransferase family protein n=1 Tax=Psychromicrobium xiongbiense TaxID=3051184 RepID=UPI0025571F57|nr:dihydrolipoamide acetyltransferase family protein [Psychromicrobium sp. YIM S02556]
MIKVFNLPDLGEGLTESEVLSWRVSEGQQVALNEVLGEVETAKAVVELPSPFAGVIAALHEKPGAVVEVGKPLVSFEIDDAGQPGQVSEPGRQRVPTLVGYGAEPERGGRPTRRPRRGVAGPAAPGPVVTEPVVTRPVAASTGERPRSTPPVRKMARDLGIDLSSLTGTGPEGLIVRQDVQAAAEARSPAASSPVEPQGAAAREVRTPIRGVRKFTAAAMVSSAFSAPHVTEFLTVDVTATMELLARLKASRTFATLKLTPLTIVAKALCLAIARHPSLNSRWDEEHQEIVTFNYVNLGIAAATPRGLTVPNIKEAQALSLVQLAEALAQLAETARAGKTTPAELSGGTISITNIGVFGIDAGTPILNPGEAAILAVGAVRKQPWEYRDEVALRQVMTLSLSFDHRVVDGEQGSRFLADLGMILADPAMLITLV